MSALDSFVGWLTGTYAVRDTQLHPGISLSDTGIIPPIAPVTAGAMTVPGVWTPDYALYRTSQDVQTNRDMTSAYAAAIASGEAGYENNFPNSSAIPNWQIALIGVAVIGVVALVRGR